MFVCVKFLIPSYILTTAYDGREINENYFFLYHFSTTNVRYRGSMGHSFFSRNSFLCFAHNNSQCCGAKSAVHNNLHI